MSSLPKSYRIYWFDMARKAVSADFVNAASDEEAIFKASKTFDASKCEIWDGRRLVAQLDQPVPNP